MGLSLRGVAKAWSAFGETIYIYYGCLAVLADVGRAMGKTLSLANRGVFGVDSAYPLGWGKKQPVLVVFDLRQ